MTLRDRVVVAALLLVFGVLSAVALRPPPTEPASAPSASPSASPPSERAYREGAVGEPTSVSPLGATTEADRILVALTFSGLVRLGPDGLMPDLASSWTVDPTGASWTFHLRPDATWQDGVPVTAHDVEFTIDTLKDPTYTGPGNASWRDVTVSVLDPSTVRFDLGDPIAGFLYAATQPIAPAHLLEGIPAADLSADPFGQAPVGSGPYRLVAWNAREATLEAYEGSPAGAVGSQPAAASPARPSVSPAGSGVASAVPATAVPATAVPATSAPATSAAASGAPTAGVSHIEFTFSTDPAVLVDAYRAGQLDAVSGLPPALAAELGAEPASRLIRYPRSTLTAVVFDLRADQPAFRDARVRRGLLEAVDRNGIVADTMAGLAVHADSPVPPSFWAYDAAASPASPVDPAAAARDLTAGGWRKTAGGWVRAGAKSVTPLRLLCPQFVGAIGCEVAGRVAAGWRALGLTVEVVPLPPTELVSKHLRTGDFEAAVLDIALGLDPDLYPLLASSQTILGGSNVSGLQDPELDRKLVAARRPGTDSARRAAWRDLQAYLTAHSFLLPIAFRDEVVVVRDTVAGPVVREIGDGSDRFYDVLTWRLADDR